MAETQNDYFYPEGTLWPVDAELDRHQRAALSSRLQVMNAPSLSCGKDLGDSYRLSWLPTTWRPSFVITVLQSPTGWTLDAAEFSNPRDAPRLQIAKRFSRELKSEEARDLASALDVAKFWTHPAWKEHEMMDGTGLVIEGRARGGYYVVSTAAGEADPLEKAGMRFFDLARLPRPEE